MLGALFIGVGWCQIWSTNAQFSASSLNLPNRDIVVHCCASLDAHILQLTSASSAHFQTLSPKIVQRQRRRWSAQTRLVPRRRAHARRPETHATNLKSSVDRRVTTRAVETHKFQGTNFERARVEANWIAALPIGARQLDGGA